MSNYFFWGLFGPESWPLWALGFCVAALLAPFGWRGRALRAVAVVAACVAIALLAFPIGYWLIRPLEDRFPPRAGVARAPDIVAVLAGGEHLSHISRSGRLELGEHNERVIEGAALARRYPSAQLLAVGGSDSPRVHGHDVDWIARTWIRLGVDRDRIRRIRDTRDTCSNARGVRAAVPSGASIMLVTSAFHMPRAVACFRAVGLDPTPYPVDYQTWPAQRLAGSFDSSPAGNLRRFQLALHEWVGLGLYRLQGRTDVLWPAATAASAADRRESGLRARSP